MHEPAGVDGGEPFGQVGGEFRDPGGTQRTGGVDPILEGRGGDVGGDHPGTFGARIGVDHLDRVEPPTMRAAATSRANRSRNVGCRAYSGRMSLTATMRPARDRPRNTWPIPPSPSRPVSR